MKILMRYVRFRHRRRHFISLPQINLVLKECIERINSRAHSRFGISRRERFDSIEKAALKPLPALRFDVGEWKQAKLHPDCYILLESVYFSAPHIHPGKLLRVKVTDHQVEIFLELERLAIHPRSRHRDGRRVKIDAHFPPASQAYYGATPQKLLCQSRFIHPELHRLVVDLFNAEVYGNIRRVQGLIRSATKELHSCGAEHAARRGHSAPESRCGKQSFESGTDGSPANRAKVSAAFDTQRASPPWIRTVRQRLARRARKARVGRPTRV